MEKQNNASIKIDNATIADLVFQLVQLRESRENNDKLLQSHMEDEIIKLLSASLSEEVNELYKRLESSRAILVVRRSDDPEQPDTIVGSSESVGAAANYMRSNLNPENYYARHNPLKRAIPMKGGQFYEWKN